jgi:hypothetical protein
MRRAPSRSGSLSDAARARFDPGRSAGNDDRRRQPCCPRRVNVRRPRTAGLSRQISSKSLPTMISPEKAFAALSRHTSSGTVSSPGTK